LVAVKLEVFMDQTIEISLKDFKRWTNRLNLQMPEHEVPNEMKMVLYDYERNQAKLDNLTERGTE